MGDSGFKVLRVKTKELSRLMMHNDESANPLSDWAKASSKITSKRKKTDDDHKELLKIGFFSSLYTNKAGKIILPDRVVEGGIRAAAKKVRLGKVIGGYTQIDDDVKLTFAGPQAPDARWKGKFYDIRFENVQGKKIIRCRPVFDEWSLEFNIWYRPDSINESELKDLVKSVGFEFGLGERRPKFGRFEIAEWENAA